MSDPRYIIEIRQTTVNGGVPFTAFTGDLVLGTTDPVEADALRRTLSVALPDYTLTLVMEETERRRVLAAFDEDHFRRRADRSGAVPIAVVTPDAAPGFDRAMNEAAAANRALGLVDDHLSNNRAMSAADAADVVLSLAYYDLLDEKRRAILADYAPDHHIALPVLRDAALALSTQVRSFPVEFPAEAYNQDRYELVCGYLKRHNPNSTTKADAKACVAEADMDFKSCVGRIVEVRFVNGYLLGTNTQNDLVVGHDEDPYRVVVCGADDLTSQWTDEDLDPKWDVRPAPDETRLDGMRSLWTFGPSYRDATRINAAG